MLMHPEIELARKNAALRKGLAAEEQFVKDYLEGYEFRGDAGDHVPNENERELLIDALAGLTGDDEFRGLVAQNESERRLIALLPSPDTGSKQLLTFSGMWK